MELDLKKLQAVELEAVKEIARICDAENISWFLVGGSVLGAVRHSGFIPWDDDADVGMLRGDYERFISVCPKYLSDRYFLQTLDTDRGYHLGYAKIRVNGTLYVQENVAHRDMHHGVFVDVYPIDEVPDSKSARRRQKLCSNLSYALCRGETVTKQGGAIKLITAVLTRILPKAALKKIGMFFDGRVKKYSGKMIVNVYGIKQYYGEIMPREYIGTPVLHRFEDINAPIPEKYDEYLTHLYGDWSKEPEDKQLKHFPVKYKF